MSKNVKGNYDKTETFGPMTSSEFDFKKHYIPLTQNYKAALWKLDELEAENQRLREALIEIREARGIFETNGLRRIARDALNRG